MSVDGPEGPEPEHRVGPGRDDLTKTRDSLLQMSRPFAARSAELSASHPCVPVVGVAMEGDELFGVVESGGGRRPLARRALPWVNLKIRPEVRTTPVLSWHSPESFQSRTKTLPSGPEPRSIPRKLGSLGEEAVGLVAADEPVRRAAPAARRWPGDRG